MKYLKELFAIYSDRESYFSKKRVESGISFMIGQLGMVLWLFSNYNTASVTEIILWSSLQFTISGYLVNQIQKEKL